MSLKYARQKGSRFERQLAKRLSTDFGAEIIRTPMSGAFGTTAKVPDFQGDLYCKTRDSILKQFFFEAKHQENCTYTNLHQWWDKAEIQGNSNVTVIFIRDNTHPDILVATSPGYIREQLEAKQLLSKVGIRVVTKKNANFWGEYYKLKPGTKMQLLILNGIQLLRYEDWKFIVGEK